MHWKKCTLNFSRKTTHFQCFCCSLSQAMVCLDFSMPFLNLGAMFLLLVVDTHNFVPLVLGYTVLNYSRLYLIISCLCYSFISRIHSQNQKNDLIFSYYKLVHRLYTPLSLSVTYLSIAILHPTIRNKQLNTRMQR